MSCSGNMNKQRSLFQGLLCGHVKETLLMEGTVIGSDLAVNEIKEKL